MVFVVVFIVVFVVVFIANVFCLRLTDVILNPGLGDVVRFFPSCISNGCRQLRSVCATDSRGVQGRIYGPNPEFEPSS